MGCWDGTCGISHFPIEEGEKARLFILGLGRATDDGRHGFSYPVGLWEPIALPVLGLYDVDHEKGQLKKAKIVGGKLTEEVIQNRGFPEVTPAMLDKLDRGKMTAHQIGHDGSQKQHPLGQMVVREDVWQSMLKILYHRPWGDDGISYEAIRAEVRLWTEAAAAQKPDSMSMFKFGHELVKKQGREQTGFLRALHDHCGSDPFIGLYPILIADKMVDGKMNVDEANAVLDEVAALYHVNKVMEELRMAWAPQSGAGSQTRRWGSHYAFHAAMNLVAFKKIEEEAERG